MISQASGLRLISSLRSAAGFNLIVSILDPKHINSFVVSLELIVNFEGLVRKIQAKESTFILQRSSLIVKRFLPVFKIVS